MTDFPVTATDTTTISSTWTPAQVLGVEIDDLTRWLDTDPGVAWTMSFLVGDSFNIAARDAEVFSFPRSLAEALTLTPSRDLLWNFGGLMEEIVNLKLLQDVVGTYSALRADTVKLKQQLVVSIAVLMSGGLTLTESMTVVRACTLVDSLGITGLWTPALTYTASWSDKLALAEVLRWLLSISIEESLSLSAVMTAVYRATAASSDSLSLSGTLSQTLMLNISETDSLTLSDEEVLQAIYTGTLTDAVGFNIALFDPNNGFTAWSMNTRTGALTEYTNYAFNSFAFVRNGGTLRYLGATSDGLYQLDGDDDAGSDIVAKLAGGMLQFSGSRLTAIKAIYLGLRAEGEFYLKLNTGSGQSYTYRVSAQSMKTTRVNVGKGLRTRYFSYELDSTGQDFDLDTIEFVPVTEVRRVEE